MMQATIDSIDEGIAVLITCDKKPVRMTLPARLLPKGCHEGDIVSITITADRPATGSAGERIRRKIDRFRDPDRSAPR
ncbi:MAG TPA: DUF3006 domain-containing protein [Methanoregulaceae archaeon]|nr:DUF3006 domain-containing protein [Methanoregulaceae archaeon]HRY75527.1 DUF3006 domain-containing protein [Methanoregulaceae archaeon]